MEDCAELSDGGAEEVYTVIPTAPEDVLPESYASPVLMSSSGRSKGGHPPTMVPSRTSNGNAFVPSPALSRAPRPPKPSRSESKGSKRKDGLPSHAFSRNYYCRFCPFNTTKSKVHLYHLVDVHGVDYKIFSCDRCDYASRWKCKVIRHRKMIHKINEPKFEPEVHDSRNQTGKRPPPVLQGANKSPSTADRRIAQRKTGSPRQSQHHQLATNQTIPSFVPAYNQTAQLLTQPINPFVNSESGNCTSVASALSHTFTQGTSVFSQALRMMKEENPDYLSPSSLSKSALQPDNNTSRRKQRKPQNVHRLVAAEEQPTSDIFDRPTEEMETEGDNSEPGDKEPLLGLFGGLDDSDSSSTATGGGGGILNGLSWRRRLMPKPVTMTTSSPISCDDKNIPSPSDELLQSKLIPDNNNTISGNQRRSLSRLSLSSSNNANNDNQHGDDNSSTEQNNVIKDRYVEEMNIDDEPHYKCKECNFISKYVWKTVKHVTDNHSIDKSVSKAQTQRVQRCTECTYVTTSKANLDRHMLRHRQDQPIKCPHCPFSSSNEHTIQRHLVEQHSQSDTGNTGKQTGSSDLDDSQDEGMISGEGEVFTCAMCGYKARNWSKMKEHMIRHSEGAPYSCSYCDSKYKRPADLNRHLKIKHNTCLADIGLDGPTLKGVMAPSAYSSSALEENMDTGEGGGGNRTPLKRPYQSNENSLGGDDDEGAIPDEDEDDGDEPKRLCIDEEGGNLQCTKCGYVAKWRSDLERHMKVHSEEKRFSCNVCFKSYKYQGDLNVHMRKAHSQSNTRTSKQNTVTNNMPSSMCKTPPPNVQVLSNEVIVNMSHAAIVNPLANLNAPSISIGKQKQQLSPKQQYQMPRLAPSPVSSAPQMPSLKPAPNSKSITVNRSIVGGKDAMVKLNSDGKPIKKGELDPSTMIHVPGGEFKCVNCRYETNFKSHLDAHMRLHPEKPFHCKFCTYASYWRGDTKKHIEKNHPEKLPGGVNPYNLVEQVFEEAVKNSPHRHKPLPEVHNMPTKSDVRSDKAVIWTPPNEEAVEEIKAPPLHTSISQSPTISTQKGAHKSKGEDGPGNVQCAHCSYRTTSESRLNAHMATHYNLKIFKCPDCGKRANWKWDVQKHMRTEHPSCLDEVIVMSAQEAKDTLDEYLKQHPEQRGKPKIGISADFKADVWQKPRPSSDSKRDLTSSSKATSIRPFRCSVCARRSNWKCDIRKHYRQVHPNRSDATVELMTKEELLEAGELEGDIDMHYPEMKGSKGSNAVKPYKCSECGKSSKWKWDVTKHIKLIHRGHISAICMYHPCMYCNSKDYMLGTDAYVIEDEDAIELLDSAPGTPDTSAQDGNAADSSLNHSPSTSKIKEGSSPDPVPRSYKSNGAKIGCYQCSICNQYSEFMWVIRRHIRSQHPDNPDAKILDLSQKGEEGAHSDSRPYICSLCGKRSNWKWDVKKHIMSVHRGNIGSILDELLNKETVIYVDGKTMEVEDGKTKEKIAQIQSQLKEEGPTHQAVTISASSNTSSSSACYNSLPTMVGLNSAVAPPSDTSSQAELSNEGEESERDGVDRSDGHVVNGKFKCGYCFFASASRHETVRHVRAKHDGKILRIQNLSKPSRDEQTTYKAAHKTSSTSTSHSVWQCSRCSFKHPEKEEALMHIAQHSVFNAYQCGVCDFADDMEYTLHKHIRAKHEHLENPDAMLLQNIRFAPSKDEMDIPTGITYTCNHCEMKTAWRSAIVRHIKEKHVVLGDIHSMFTKHGSNKPESSGGDQQSRRYNCTICPYRTDKVSMFNEHTERHTQRRQTDLKCHFCDYWVTATRLLHQHLKLHNQEASRPPAANGAGEHKEKSSKYLVSGGLAQCSDCPYRGKPKDLKAHRRLHKQRDGADYKCPECPYWVNHSRLLQQHAKVHSPGYRRGEFTSAQAIEETPMEDVAAFKQHLISSQVLPVKLECGEGADHLKRRLHTCDKCPFASNNLLKVEEHAEGHGAYTEAALKCKFCDFYCEVRELMAHHIKVHSLQYQGELDDEDELLSIQNGEEESEEEDLEDVGGRGEVVESDGGFTLKFRRNKAVLEKQKRGLSSRKYSCEKCPYTSAVKLNFRRHNSLHSARAGYVTCTFCDYSVPTTKHLKSHETLHQQPNRNLLATQSITNLTKLRPVQADVHLAQTGLLSDGSLSHAHDHLNLYENAEFPSSNDIDEDRQSLDGEGEPEFIDLAEFGSKVSQRTSDEGSDSSSGEESGGSPVVAPNSAVSGMEEEEEFDVEDGEEVWICRFCDRAFDSELELTSHEKQHS